MDNQNNLIAALKSILHQAIEAVASNVVTNGSHMAKDEMLPFLQEIDRKAGLDHTAEHAFPSVEAIWLQLRRVMNFSFLKKATFIVDALDECDSQDLEPFLCLLEQDGNNEKINWILLSRSEAAISDHLLHSPLVGRVNLDFHPKEVTAAVEAFINVKVEELARIKRYDKSLIEFVSSTL